jgi:hypothetical protein
MKLCYRDHALGFAGEIIQMIRSRGYGWTYEVRLLMSEVAPFGLPRGRVRLQWLVLAELLGWFHEAIEGVSGELDQIGLATWCGLDGSSP